MEVPDFWRRREQGAREKTDRPIGEGEAFCCLAEEGRSKINLIPTKGEKDRRGEEKKKEEKKKKKKKRQKNVRWGASGSVNVCSIGKEMELFGNGKQ